MSLFELLHWEKPLEDLFRIGKVLETAPPLTTYAVVGEKKTKLTSANVYQVATLEPGAFGFKV